MCIWESFMEEKYEYNGHILKKHSFLKWTWIYTPYNECSNISVHGKSTIRRLREKTHNVKLILPTDLSVIHSQLNFSSQWNHMHC